MCLTSQPPLSPCSAMRKSGTCAAVPSQPATPTYTQNSSCGARRRRWWWWRYAFFLGGGRGSSGWWCARAPRLVHVRQCAHFALESSAARSARLQSTHPRTHLVLAHKRARVGFEGDGALLVSKAVGRVLVSLARAGASVTERWRAWLAPGWSCTPRTGGSSTASLDTHTHTRSQTRTFVCTVLQ
jgi:hypothetical protein